MASCRVGQPCCERPAPAPVACRLLAGTMSASLKSVFLTGVSLLAANSGPLLTRTQQAPKDRPTHRHAPSSANPKFFGHYSPSMSNGLLYMVCLRSGLAGPGAEHASREWRASTIYGTWQQRPCHCHRAHRCICGGKVVQPGFSCQSPCTLAQTRQVRPACSAANVQQRPHDTCCCSTRRARPRATFFIVDINAFITT